MCKPNNSGIQSSQAGKLSKQSELGMCLDGWCLNGMYITAVDTADNVEGYWEWLNNTFMHVYIKLCEGVLNEQPCV